jgi:murein DD-endopeptidase MepM/ murein hydrolase activator NlpD
MTSLETVLINTQNVRVIADSISLNKYVALDLSVLNHNLSKESLADSAGFENYIENYLTPNAKVAYGGYNEERNLYQRSTIFKDEKTEERNIHIGLDLWIKAGTPILAALEGHFIVLISMLVLRLWSNYYTGTQRRKPNFYTLYGHLSLDSLEDLTLGTVYKKGQQIAALEIQQLTGIILLIFISSYKTWVLKWVITLVFVQKRIDFYLDNCPDPNLLLKIKS